MPTSQSSFESQRRRFPSSTRPNRTDGDMQGSERLRALAAVKKELQDKIRDDWVFLWPPADGPEAQASGNPSADEAQHVWRERELDSSPSPPSSPGTMSNLPSPTINPYRFDSPDAIAHHLSAQEHERHRKRRKQVDDETSWNDGLRCWTARRDAWSGGRLRRPSEHHDVFSPLATPLSPLFPTNPTPSSSSSSPALPLREQVPLAPPVLPPSTWARPAMSPALQARVYAKAVLASERPALPINLAEMTQILVQGWKDNNEWPPKTTPAEPLIARKRDAASERSPATPGVLVPGLALREKAGGAGRAEADKRGGLPPGKGLSKGVGAMKKALGITSPACGSPVNEASEREWER